MKFYRYEGTTYASMVDSEAEYGKPALLIPNVKINILEYNLHKETPKGYWIGFGYNSSGNIKSNARWVSKTAKKRYAYPTKEEALNNFLQRTKRRKQILESQLRTVDTILKLALKIEI